MTMAPSTLEELVAPLTEQEFLSLLRERKLTLLRGSDPDRFKPLLDWRSLLGRIERGEYPRGLADFRIVRESTTVHPEHWLTKDKADNTTKVDIAKLEGFLAEGHSLVVTPIHPYVPALATLCNNIAVRLSEQIKVGVVVTTGTAGAFKLHYDPEDLIIVQVEGTKRWQIYGPAVSNPIIGMPKEPPPPETMPIFDEVLQAGDLLFLPAGSWHHCENGPDRSLHLGIFCIPPTCLHAVRSLVSHLISDEMFRIPLTRFEDVLELKELEATAKDRLIERIQQMELRDFLSQPKNKKVSTPGDSEIN